MTYIPRTQFPDSASGPFGGARSKILRSRQFIEELKHEADDYRLSSPISVSINNGAVEIKWAAVTNKPAAITGDALHNARAALDLAAAALVRAHTGNDDSVYFPFSKDQASLDSTIRSRRLHRAGEDLVCALKKRAPYKGGNKSLFGLHLLDIQDKHRGVILTTSKMGLKISAQYYTDGELDPLLQVDLDEFGYIFEESSDAFAGEMVVETLSAILVEVRDIVDELEQYLP
jgi:hypothetical protein